MSFRKCIFVCLGAAVVVGSAFAFMARQRLQSVPPYPSGIHVVSRDSQKRDLAGEALPEVVELNNTVDDARFSAFVEHENSQAVHSLLILDSPISSLRSLNKLPALRWLHLSHSNMKGTDFPVIPKLQHLQISVTELDSSWAQAIARNKSLEVVHITASNLSDDELKIVAELPLLVELSLYKNPISDAGTKHLAGLEHLKTLSLAGTHVTEAGIRNLQALTKLESLDISQTQITSSGIPMLLAIPRLHTLKLRDCKLTDIGVAPIWQMPALAMLDLSGIVRLTDKCLWGAERCKSLKWLWLSGRGFTDDALSTVAKIPSLERVYLYDTSVTTAAIVQLRELRPDVKCYGNPIDDDGTRAQFAVAEQKPAIERLEQLGVTIGVDKQGHAFEVLLSKQPQPSQILKELQNLPTVTRLVFDHSPVVDELQSLQDLPQLKVLVFRNCDTLSDSAMKQVARVVSLNHVTIHECPLISKEGIRHLAALPQIDLLELHQMKISDDVFESIGQMRSLRGLQIYDVPITGIGIARSRDLPELESLVIRGCPIEVDAAADIAQLKALRHVTLGLTTSDSFKPKDLSSTVLKLRNLREDLEIVTID